MTVEKLGVVAFRSTKKAAAGIGAKMSIASLPQPIRSPLAKERPVFVQWKPTGPAMPKTRQQVYDEAKRRICLVAR